MAASNFDDPSEGEEGGARVGAPGGGVRLALAAEGPPWAPGAEVEIPAAQAHYLANVMRLGPGAALRVFSMRDGEWRAEIARLSKRGGVLRAAAALRPVETPPDLELLFAPLKKTRTDFIVEKATELGARRIRPVFTRRTAAGRVNVERLSALAREAAEQCDRVFLPEIAPPERLETALAGWDPARTLLFCDERRTAAPLAAAAAAAGAPAAILIGPEGGFAPEEAAALERAPFVRPAALGPRILRADTAAAAALAIWQAAAGDGRG